MIDAGNMLDVYESWELICIHFSIKIEIKNDFPIKICFFHCAVRFLHSTFLLCCDSFLSLIKIALNRQVYINKTYVFTETEIQL